MLVLPSSSESRSGHSAPAPTVSTVTICDLDLAPSEQAPHSPQSTTQSMQAEIRVCTCRIVNEFIIAQQVAEKLMVKTYYTIHAKR